MKTRRILLIEDDDTIAYGLTQLLADEGFETILVRFLKEAMEVEPGSFCLALLDLGLPDGEGWDFLERLCTVRTTEKGGLQKGFAPPVIILTAREDEADIMRGLDMGADDYVAKPYHPAELSARVKSHLRRYTSLGDIHTVNQDQLTNGRLSYHTGEKILYADGEAVRLTATETKIMELFMKYPGRIFPAEEIYERVWEEQNFASENTVMVHIRRIREKIELNPKETEYLKVVWGIGYKMEKKER